MFKNASVDVSSAVSGSRILDSSEHVHQLVYTALGTQ